MDKKRILGLDISTKTIGMALFEEDGKLLELTHITPKIKPQPENKLEELFKKVDAFEKLLTRYMDLEIEKVVIEEPLLNSNNVYTVGTLLRFNGMISKVVDDVLNSGKTLIYGVNRFLHAPVKKISTLVLVDRNHKSFPVNADYVGLSLATTFKQHIKVVFSESGDAAYLQ
jgi:pyrimidine operon attenuation protein/uracil phosphoribosyltransferase